MNTDILISQSILALYDSERKLLKRITNILFAIAGCSWFLLYLPESIINHDVHEAFKLQQYQIYVSLLTIWGLDYKRQLNRIAIIAMKADDLQKQCTNIEAQDVQDNLQFFEVLTLKRKSKGKHLALFITWIFLFLTTYLIINQFMLIFSQ